MPSGRGRLTLPKMTVRYLWWRSCYDGELHAFPMAPGTRLAHQHYRASCTHAAPPDLEPEGSDGPRCELCVMILETRQST
ncbi:hypothetical protein SAMN05192558_102649 [Actinokineospora alba]|uniref:Uncharacterized protein n=2 Tax=Actinokineospora alba TaxID=504798 RepID=A0A1H0IPR2_9PSEU|nr:hypothetical protein C8E96_6486 [Actinokineospora alba]SDI91657.1 hypothetical protein SAMN05421871_108348 [Actinokineospora alba]SDO33427.1 hypothetical protein SAMN05192558_102649 [Actinokineospora alba]